MSLRLNILGDFELSDDGGRRLTVSSKKCRGLLAALATSPSGKASRQHLADLLWGDRDDEQARASLRQALASLRRDLGAAGELFTDGEGGSVTLDRASVEVDAWQAEVLSRSDEVAALRSAVGLFRGPFLGDADIALPQFEDWLRSERSRLQSVLATLLERLWAAESAERRVEIAKRLVALEPLRESAHRALMQSFSDIGERGLAIQHYADCRNLLRAELGVEPGPEIEALRAQLLAHRPSTAAGQAPGADNVMLQSGLKPAGAVTGSDGMPSIVVLPFDNLSGDPEQDYFADGVVDEITTGLARMRWLRVIARSSSFAYKGRPIDVKQIGRDLDVRYALEGSVRRAGQRLRISGQLIDTGSGAHLWADRFDGGLEDIFGLQDEITASVIGEIAPRLERAEIDRALRKPTGSWDAYDHYLRGLANMHSWTRETTTAALAFFYRAIDFDPGFASAYARAAQCFEQRKVSGWFDDPHWTLSEVEHLVRRSIEFGSDDAVPLGMAGYVRGYVLEDLDGGAALMEKALRLNPNLIALWTHLSFVQIFQGEHQLALLNAERGMRLGPNDPILYDTRLGAALALFFLERYEEGLRLAELSLREGPIFAPGLRILAANSTMAGDQAQARRAVDQALLGDPALRVSNLRRRIPLRRSEDLSRWENALRLAGLPE